MKHLVERLWISLILFGCIVAIWNYCHPPKRMDLGPEQNAIGYYAASNFKSGYDNTLLGTKPGRDIWNGTPKEGSKDLK